MPILCRNKYIFNEPISKLSRSFCTDVGGSVDKIANRFRNKHAPLFPQAMTL